MEKIKKTLKIKDKNGNIKKVKKPKFNIWFLIFTIAGAFLLFDLIFSKSIENKTQKTLTEAVKEINENKIEKIEFDDSKVTLFRKDKIEFDPERKITTKIPQNTDFLEYVEKKDLESKVESIEYKQRKDYFEYINLVLNVLFFGFLAYFMLGMFRKGSGAPGGGGIFSVGRSKAKLFKKEEGKITTFKDVAFDQEVKQEFIEIVDFLKNSKKYKKVGARIPKGILLIGPAGVGKTLMARAIAGEANVPFYSVSGSEFMEMFVGVGSSRVRDLFRKARETSPSLIFIDEMDAIGKHRGGFAGHDGEREQTLNQILVEMDGFDNKTDVIVIAATNRPDTLDKALIRPGRFDRKITLNLPAMEEREEIIKIHMRGKPFEQKVTAKKVAKRTTGFSGADIENVLNEAAILAGRKNKLKISSKDVNEAITKVKLGPQRKKLQDEEDKKLTAYHEAGHAVVAHFLKEVEPVRAISIVARTMSLGHTDLSSDKQVVNYSKEALLQRIAMMMGGRVAEEIFNNTQTAGASNDIERATDLAKKMVMELGMSKLGPVNFAGDKQGYWASTQNNGTNVGSHSEELLKKIDSEVSSTILTAKTLAEKILKEQKDKVENVVKVLMERETIEQEEFEELMNK